MLTQGLVDLSFSGPRLTLCNKQQGQALNRELLDRGVANDQWRLLFQRAMIQHCARTSSDHAPIILDTFSDNFNGPQPFRFETFCIREPSFKVVVQQAWEVEFSDSLGFQICQNIKVLKRRLKQWNRKSFGDIQETLKREEILWTSKFRGRWLTTSYLSTKYFHLSITIRKRCNCLERLKNDYGYWLNCREEISNHICFSFQTLFSSSCLLIDNDLDNLIKTLIFDMDNEILCKISDEQEV